MHVHAKPCTCNIRPGPGHKGNIAMDKQPVGMHSKKPWAQCERGSGIAVHNTESERKGCALCNDGSQQFSGHHIHTGSRESG